jgi:hypothetical protein
MRSYGVGDDEVASCECRRAAAPTEIDGNPARPRRARQRPPVPPLPGDRWRIFCGRFELPSPGGQETRPHPAWAWNRHGVYDTHLPERWTAVTFRR